MFISIIIELRQIEIICGKSESTSTIYTVVYLAAETILNPLHTAV